MCLLAALNEQPRLRTAVQACNFFLLTSAESAAYTGGKRSGADYSAESTAVREMYEETSGAVCSVAALLMPRSSHRCGCHIVTQVPGNDSKLSWRGG